MTNETTGADLKSATEQDSKKLFIETYGCQMNVADSEVIASIMQMAGYSPCETSGILPFSEKEKEKPDSRCIGLYGRTCERRPDRKSSC